MGNKRYRIMLVIHALGYGGAGKMIVKLADALAERDDFEVILYVEEQVGKHYPMSNKVKVWQETQFFSNYYIRHSSRCFNLGSELLRLSPISSSLFRPIRMLCRSLQLEAEISL